MFFCENCFILGIIYVYLIMGWFFMNINIDDDVKQSLKFRQKNIITIDYGILSSCWSIMPEIFVRLKNPSDSSKFMKYNKDDFNIYINKDLKVEGDVRIKFPRYISDLSEREFEVTGVNIPKTGN